MPTFFSYLIIWKSDIIDDSLSIPTEEEPVVEENNEEPVEEEVQSESSNYMAIMTQLQTQAVEEARQVLFSTYLNDLQNDSLRSQMSELSEEERNKKIDELASNAHYKTLYTSQFIQALNRQFTAHPELVQYFTKFSPFNASKNSSSSRYTIDHSNPISITPYALEDLVDPSFHYLHHCSMSTFSPLYFSKTALLKPALYEDDYVPSTLAHIQHLPDKQFVPYLACGPLNSTLVKGHFVVAFRGNCTFTEKAKNAYVYNDSFILDVIREQEQ